MLRSNSVIAALWRLFLLLLKLAIIAVTLRVLSVLVRVMAKGALRSPTSLLSLVLASLQVTTRFTEACIVTNSTRKDRLS